jgi:hypothetical protein
MQIKTEKELGLAGSVIIDVCVDLRGMATNKALTADDLKVYESRKLDSLREYFKNQSAAERQRR